MTGRQQRERTVPHALRRVFAVALLLAGLVAMHALTVGHDPVPISVAAGTKGETSGGLTELAGPAHVHRGAHPHAAVLAMAAGTGSMPGASTPRAGMSLDEPTVATPAMTQLDGCQGCGHDPGDSHAGSNLFDICLAVLLAGAVALVLVAASRPALPGIGGTVGIEARGVGSRLAAPRPPSLSQLCVLRT